jgi:hypothetical protein
MAGVLSSLAMHYRIREGVPAAETVVLRSTTTMD